jgi:chemotaxis signal transduction protein/nucleoid-associated protein YgaU
MRELTIFNLGELKYGIWRNEAIAVKDVEHIHWLPPIPKHIAGMSILEGRTVTMFDLPACIGLSPLARKRQKYSVIVFENEKNVAGFLVDFIIGHFSISSETVHKMPGYLRTEVIDTCAVHNSELIPVISLSKLFKIVLQADFKPPKAEFRIPEIKQDKTSLVNTVRVFKSGGEYFAIPSENIEKASVKPGPVSNMALVHKHVSGITFHGGKLIPLVHMSSCINEQTEQEGQTYTLEITPLVLIADIAGQSFGLLIDSDRGEWDDENFTLKPLPPLVQSSWMKRTIIHGKEIIPIIDSGVLLSDRSDENDRDSLPQRYTPDSNIEAIFGKEGVKVIEFSLLGLRYALPESEVEDSFRVKTYRRLPNVISIVAGVAEHDGELLPVLDLGMYFGRRSPVTPEWWMILVKNGDFQALILAEAVMRERLLPVNIQQGLPFEEPHQMVYGCYPDEAAVRLVLNVEAMTVHFDEVRFKGIISMFAEEVEPAPEEIGPAILELEAAAEMVKDEIIEEETKISEEPVRSAAPVAAEEIEEEEEEIQVEQKTEEIEVIEQVEEIIEPELEEFVELVESLIKEETEEVKEIQEQGEISITDLSLTEHMRDHFKTEPFEKTTRWPFLIMLAAFSFLLLLMPALYFFGVLDNWIGKKDKGKIETSVLMRMPVPVQVEIPKLSTPKKSPSTLPIPTKPRKQLVPEKPPTISPDIVVYTVKKGDTLFKITAKYTGNGFNYPKVAKRNKIKNPDLIFPEQKIQIKR